MGTQLPLEEYMYRSKAVLLLLFILIVIVCPLSQRLVFDCLFIFRLALWPSAGEKADFLAFPLCCFTLCRLNSCSGFKAGCGIRLYRFLIIAFPPTFYVVLSRSLINCVSHSSTASLSPPSLVSPNSADKNDKNQYEFLFYVLQIRDVVAGIPCFQFSKFGSSPSTPESVFCVKNSE